MEKYTVSARKYRPMTFDTVVGQEHITTTLKNAIQKNQLAHAFLFCGPRGVGKTTAARILAKTINCQNLTPEVEACGSCESCKAFAGQKSFNIHELDAASQNKVENMRQLIEQVQYPPHSGQYKIYIIDEVHMLSTGAFNAFLKTLEEPPEYAIFILATTEKHKILPTILSRCQIFDFNRIQVSDIHQHLTKIAEKENIPAESEALHLIAQKADGGLRDALSIFDRMASFSNRQITYEVVVENLNILDYDYYFRVTAAFKDGEVPAALLILDEILRKGFDPHHFLVGLSEHLRDLMVAANAKTKDLLEITGNVRARYIEQAQELEWDFLLSALNIISQFDTNYNSAKNKRLHTELCLMKLCHIFDALSWHKNPPAAVAGEKKSLN